MDIQTKKNNFWLEHPAISLLLFVSFILFIRLVLRGSVLLLDESEQVVLAQNLLPGYPNQPPLYTWLQYFFFHVLGVNLFSLALLKCLLLFGCLYLFYLISQLHCQNNVLAWCALASWALIPSIGLDLVKDNTHSILVLFAVCLTWYWFHIYNHCSEFFWYGGFGGIIGIGLLAKFNYLLFFIIFFISSLTIQAYRKRLMHPFMLVSLIMTMIITSPYAYWLLKYSDLGFASAYKLNPSGVTYLYGLVQLFKTSLLFTAPLFVAAIFFHGSQFKQKSDLLLYRYHLLCLPILATIVILGRFSEFETRWLIPILFLCPVLYFSQLKYSPALKTKVISFFVLCAATQVLYFLILIYNSHSDHTKRKQVSLQQILEFIKADSSKRDYIVSDSYWLLGNIATTLPTKNLWLIQPTKEYLPKGRSLIVWTTPQLPYWINLFAHSSLLTEIKLLVNPETKRVIGGQAFGYIPSKELVVFSMNNS
ncbi:ArnT family glycosyltransferase [Legionella clemsonensis]|uniref:Glycosyltransferase RgtA/B/C/D-like domain-containing protein n=1 Tax=Legionella clemsonensis TaxID=1867846 RepID=A0A222P0U7_9GAMM|nr:glycosyltransferase family 39 protein [Legionella clemsonensis]ASQ45451.1 hypothetical protein clem_04465 [Legionella clemsonensis]